MNKLFCKCLSLSLFTKYVPQVSLNVSTSSGEFLDWNIISQHMDICLWLSLVWKGITRINALSNIRVSVSRTESTASLNASLEYQFKTSLMEKIIIFWRKKILMGLYVVMVIIFAFTFSFSINYINLHFYKVNFFCLSMFLMWHTVFFAIDIAVP